MYHANMQSCGMKDMQLKTVGKSGQISLGKSLAGTSFIVEETSEGDFILKRALVIPENEQWLHTPAMKEKLERAAAWVKANPPRETDLDELERAALAHQAAKSHGRQ